MDSLLENNLIMLSAGLLVALPVLFVLLFKKKMYKKFSYVLLTAVLCIVLSVCITFGFIAGNAVTSSEADTDGISDTVDYSSEENYSAAFSGFLLERNTEYAEQIINECADVHGWNDNCTLMTAHLAFAQQNYAKAASLYSKVKDNVGVDESLIDASKKLAAYAKFNNSADDDPAGGETQPPLSDEQIKEAEELIAGKADTLLDSTLIKTNGAEDFREASKIVFDIENLWEEATLEGRDVSDKLESVSSKLSSAKKAKVLNKIGVWRNARMKLRLLDEDYSKFASELDEYATCEEYTVALDLYLNGKISSKMIKKAFKIEEFEGMEKVISRLEEIKRNAKLEEEQEDSLEKQIEKLKEYKKDPLFYHFENKLIKFAKDKDKIKSSSKIYLALAQYSSHIDRSSLSNEYFSEALTAAANSDDEAYAEAMNALSEAIRGSGSYESVKDVDKWAGQVAENSSLVKGSEKLIITEENKLALKEAVQSYTVKASAAITINSVDTSNFNEITATIQVSDEFMSEKELKNLIKIYDCSIEIDSFTVTKVTYNKANIILCCDNSGSMSGSVDSLKNAVDKFLENTTGEEQLGFYTFDNSIMQSLPLGSSIEDIKAAVQNMGAYGGTNIKGTVYNILNSVSTDFDANNILILMTDGQDGYSGVSIDDIGNMAAAKGYVVYVMGMGSGIGVENLTNLANATGGQFIYSPTDAQLESLYAFIHGQVKNKYKITYKTADTLTTSNRPLEIEINGQNVSDVRYYSISDSQEETTVIPFDKNVSISGLETRYIVKHKNTVDINVLGTGFQSTDTMYVNLIGNRTYNLRATYVDENTFKISIPMNIAIDIYDAEITLNNRYTLLKNELTVSDGITNKSAITKNGGMGHDFDYTY